MEFLDTLIVERNKLTGSIPDFDLPNLIFIDCGVNELSGNFPSFSKTPKLRFLDCDFNRIEGSIPDFDLPKLQVFDCNVNSLTGEIPNFTKLPSLRFFDCSRNQLKGEIPTFNLSPRLLKFYAHINQLEGKIPDLSHLLELSEIRADSNQLSGCLPIDWDFCRLDTFDFRKNKQLPWEGDLANMCPPQNLDPFNAPCDDQDPLTLNDSIRIDCSCVGCPLAFTELSPTLCFGDSLVVNGTVYNESNPSGRQVIPTSAYCDSTIFIQPIFLDQVVVEDDSVKICEGEEYFWRNEIFIDSGTYVRMIPAIDGCDTLARLILKEQNQIDIEAVDDFFTFSPDSSVMTFFLFENDLLPSAKTFSLISEPMIGNISVIEPGRIRYMPSDQSVSGQDSFSYKICDGFCTDVCKTAKVIINIDGNCFAKAKEKITNAFSPNDDDTNDFFDPLAEYIELGCDVNESNAEMTIINRWGDRIFSANPYQPWSGKTSSGKAYPEATYYFILKIETINKPIKGPINLIEINN